MFVGPQTIVPTTLQPAGIAPGFITPGGGSAPPLYAPTPYLLEFLTPAWNTENGANWQAPQGLGVFDSPGAVSHDAQSPNDPTWGAILYNAEPSFIGDARLIGSIDPITATNQGQMQILKLDFSTVTGFAALAIWTGGANGMIALGRGINGVFTILTTAVIGPAANYNGLWLKVLDMGANTARVRAYLRNVAGGTWSQVATHDDVGSGAYGIATKPAWGFNSNGGTPVLDSQVYNANKFDGTRDGSFAP